MQELIVHHRVYVADALLLDLGLDSFEEGFEDKINGPFFGQHILHEVLVLGIRDKLNEDSQGLDIWLLLHSLHERTHNVFVEVEVLRKQLNDLLWVDLVVEIEELEERGV